MLQIHTGLRREAESVERMASLSELIERLRRIIKEREAALQATKQVLSRLERMASDFPPEALEIIEKALAQDGNLERSIAMLEPKRQRGILSPKEVASLIRNVLVEAGKPMKRGDIVRELEKQGVPLVGSDKNKNVGTIIWRHPELFVSVEGLGYWIRGVRIPGVYEPTD